MAIVLSAQTELQRQQRREPTMNDLLVHRALTSEGVVQDMANSHEWMRQCIMIGCDLCSYHIDGPYHEVNKHEGKY